MTTLTRSGGISSVRPALTQLAILPPLLSPPRPARVRPGGLCVQLALHRLPELLAHALHRHPPQHRVEEALDEHVLGLVARQATAHQVEQRLLLDRPHRGAVAAADDVAV